MLIIIEGVDKTGKSTLTDFILKNMDRAFLLKIGDRPKDSSYVQRQKIKDYYWKVLNVYQYGFKDCVLLLDRFFLSELVYSYKRGYEASKDSEILMMKEELEKNGYDIVLIYCNTAIEKIAEKFATDKEDYAKIEDIKILQSRYEMFLSELKIRTIPYDYTVTSPQQVLNKLQSIKQEIDSFRKNKERR